MNKIARGFAAPMRHAESVIVDFSRGGNSDRYIGEGWSGAEARHRWSFGKRSLLALPPIAEAHAFVLTLECSPLQLPGVDQELEIEWNGRPLLIFRPSPGAPFAIPIAGELVNASRENLLIFRNPHATAPADHLSGNGDTRLLAFAWTRLTLAPTEARLMGAPAWLAENRFPVDANKAQIIAGGFQSLGQNCELGMFQRKCGVEPLGLLRFASIFPAALVQALRSRFAGMEAASDLSFAAAKPGGELIGRHAVYGLDYHTFKNENEVDPKAFAESEARRLGYLSRLVLEQLDNNEKIFVRRGDFQAECEILALYQLIRNFNDDARLLLVQEAPAAERWKAGRVEQLAANLYRGYLSKFADSEDVPGTLAVEDWMKICATLYAREQQSDVWGFMSSRSG